MPHTLAFQALLPPIPHTLTSARFSLFPHFLCLQDLSLILLARRPSLPAKCVRLVLNSFLFPPSLLFKIVIVLEIMLELGEGVWNQILFLEGGGVQHSFFFLEKSYSPLSLLSLSLPSSPRFLPLSPPSPLSVNNH